MVHFRFPTPQLKSAAKPGTLLLLLVDEYRNSTSYMKYSLPSSYSQHPVPDNKYQVRTGHCSPSLNNTFMRRQNGRNFPKRVFKHIYLNKNEGIPIQISLKFIANDPINNTPALFQINSLGAAQATSHYLNQWWVSFWRLYMSLGHSALLRHVHWSCDHDLAKRMVIRLGTREQESRSPLKARYMRVTALLVPGATKTH